MAADQPFCDWCGQYQRVIREDGTMRNHRGLEGEPCEGSRKNPSWRKGVEPSKKNFVLTIGQGHGERNQRFDK